MRAVQWTESFEEGITRATAEKKPLFPDF